MRQDENKREMFDRLQRMATEGKIVTLPIVASPRDGKSPIVDFGTVQVRLHSGWNAPKGVERVMKVGQTRNGRFYMMPADIKLIPEGEFDLDTPRTLIGRLVKDGNGKLMFRLENGQIVLLLNPVQWLKAGAEKYIGKEIEITAWPKSTCLVGIPRFGYQKLDATSRISTSEFSAENLRIVAAEEASGIIRVKTPDGVALMRVGTLLGIDYHEKLEKRLITSRRNKVLKDHNPDQNTEIVIAGTKLDPQAFVAAVKKAEQILNALINSGVMTLIELYEIDLADDDSCEVEEPEAQVETQEDGEIVECPNPVCKTKSGKRTRNRYQAVMGAKKDAKCGVCSTPLFSELQPAVDETTVEQPEAPVKKTNHKVEVICDKCGTKSKISPNNIGRTRCKGRDCLGTYQAA